VGREQDSGETEREFVRDRALLKMRDGVGNKFDNWRKYLWQMWKDNLRRLRWPLTDDGFPIIRIFSLLIC
jgi:hypothetical protein